ncbi:hypothetical protein QJS04_geneDACA019369 [Acorus gramineus]|uniref:Uncharacterized protein n=1 Tax=Acorus gramineus TaxID=55184 RepID=A0AAV9ARA0_ACOGR|nr:hypothetical protein QJS04_geneDACA019369 [Acorus gramineus]
MLETSSSSFATSPLRSLHQQPSKARWGIVTCPTSSAIEVTNRYVKVSEINYQGFISGGEGEKTTTGSEGEDDNDASNEEDWTSSSEVKSDEDNNDELVSAEAIKKLLPFSVEEFEKRVSGESESEPSPKDSGDRVKYIGDDVLIECDQRCLSRGQRGEVYEVNGSQVAVILDSTENGKDEAQEGKTTEVIKPSIYWIDSMPNIEHDYDTEAEDCDFLNHESEYELFPNNPLLDPEKLKKASTLSLDIIAASPTSNIV